MNKYMIENTAITPACQELLERVRQAKRLNKLSVETIAKEAGMHRPTVQNQLYGRYNLDIRVVLALARLCPNISCNWLLRGEGAMLITDDTKQVDSNLSEALNNNFQQITTRLTDIEQILTSKHE